MAGLAVVRDLGRLVQAGADTMADILAHERIAIALGILLNGVADVGDAVADAGKLDALEKALARDADQAQGLIRALAARERPRAVAVEAAVAGADVDADDIALMQDAVAGDAVDDLVIDGDACRRREAAVGHEARRRAGLRDELVHFAVDLAGGHTRLHHLTRDGTRASGDPAGLPHEIHFRIGFDDNHSRPRAFSIAAVVASMVGWLSTLTSLPRWA